MSNKNKHNSIVFLTTLSVYLGLVLIGAPPVLAQAALTRNFDIQNEVKVKDDLDKKPDDTELKNLSGSIENYFEELEKFIVDLQKLHSIEKFDLDYDKFAIEIARFVPCDVDGDPIAEKQTTKRVDNHWLEPAITDAVYRFEDSNSLSDCLPSNKFGKYKATNSSIKFSYDKSELKVELSGFKVSQHNAQQIAGNFNKAFKLYEPDEEEVIVRKIYENTSFKSENNQVFIVTRLPRGSLEELLKNAKAESK